MANERGIAQTQRAEWAEALCPLGVVTHVCSNLSMEREVKNLILSQMNLERTTEEGESPVGEREKASGMLLSTTGHEEPCGNLGGPPSKAKYLWPPIVNQYREGKAKSTPKGE